MKVATLAQLENCPGWRCVWVGARHPARTVKKRCTGAANDRPARAGAPPEA